MQTQGKHTTLFDLRLTSSLFLLFLFVFENVKSNCSACCLVWRPTLAVAYILYWHWNDDENWDQLELPRYNWHQKAFFCATLPSIDHQQGLWLLQRLPGFLCLIALLSGSVLYNKPKQKMHSWFVWHRKERVSGQKAIFCIYFFKCLVSSHRPEICRSGELREL